MAHKLLVVDDDLYICELLSSYLKKRGYETTSAFTGTDAVKQFNLHHFDLVLCDFRLPDKTGLEVMQQIKQKKKQTPVILMTAYGEIQKAVKSIRAGAYDYVTKPILPEEIEGLIERALGQPGDSLVSPSKLEFIAGESEDIRQILKQIELAAPTDISILIQGETGTGKEYFARKIHELSNRSNKSFIPVDCGALPKELANSELFGHLKGAFTGAIQNKKGVFEQANGGTLFLDEIGNLSYNHQVKLLRAIQEKKIQKVGGTKAINTDVRIIAASNDDLNRLVKQNKFREDLYHRVNEFKISIPDLKNRKEDILIFADHFLKQAAAQFNKKISGFDNEARRVLFIYPWPGNIRELQNVIKRAALLCPGNMITTHTLPKEILDYQENPDTNQQQNLIESDPYSLKKAAEKAEHEVILQALKDSNYNKSKTAKLLGVDRKTLYNKLRKHSLLEGDES